MTLKIRGKCRQTILPKIFWCEWKVSCGFLTV
jgi:hypothetical protein